VREQLRGMRRGRLLAEKMQGCSSSLSEKQRSQKVAWRPGGLAGSCGSSTVRGAKLCTLYFLRSLLCILPAAQRRGLFCAAVWLENRLAVWLCSERLISCAQRSLVASHISERNLAGWQKIQLWLYLCQLAVLIISLATAG